MNVILICVHLFFICKSHGGVGGACADNVPDYADIEVPGNLIPNPAVKPGTSNSVLQATQFSPENTQPRVSKKLMDEINIR